MSSTRQALEDYLAANPDDIAAHSAYADWLTENGDPRGEYIRLQLAFEDRNQPADQVRSMAKTAFAIRRKHEVEWLGSLYNFVYSPRKGRSDVVPVGPDIDIIYRFGWIHEIETRIPTIEFWAALATSSISRLLHTLSVKSDLNEESIRPVGWLDYAENFPNLRHLSICTDGLLDEHVERLLESGVLNRLRGLDLTGCYISDDGALALARDPAVTKLEYLHLHYNLLSPIGIDVLATIGIEVGVQRFGNQRGLARHED